MTTVFKYLRFVIIIPIIGLILAASAFFIIGGVQLILLIGEAVGTSLGLVEMSHEAGSGIPFSIEIVEYVHQFLIGTVLFITAMGFYQLFIDDIDLPSWLKVHSTDQLETALIGVTVVVLAVNFMTVVFTQPPANLLAQGVGTAAIIASLGIFVGVRAWADKSRELAGKPDTSDGSSHD